MSSDEKAEKAKRQYAPRMPPEERREQVLDATLKLIAGQGYERVSMEAVARAAGVTKPVVYDLFGSLADLLEALLEREQERALLQLSELLPLPGEEADPEQVLTDSLHAFMRAVEARPDAWGLILMPPEAMPGIVRERVEKEQTQLAAQLETIVRWGLDGLDVQIDDVELAVEALIVLVREGGRMHLNDPKAFPPERLSGFASALIAAVRPQS